MRSNLIGMVCQLLAAEVVIRACHGIQICQERRVTKSNSGFAHNAYRFAQSGHFALEPEKLARNARGISTLGKELHDRLRLLGAHIDNVGKGLDRAVESYNKAVGSLKKAGVSGISEKICRARCSDQEVSKLSPIETTTRNLTLDFDDPEKAETVERTDPPIPMSLASQKALSSKASW